MRSFFTILIILFSLTVVFPIIKDTSNTNQEISAVRINQLVNIDGNLHEEFWKQIIPVNQFTQRNPDEGKEPTQKTEIKIAFDNAALYIGARMHDSSPDSILARLVRKDVEITSDLFAVFLDPYFDRRSGFYFAMNAAGTQYDGVLYNDSWDDETWDGVWEGKVNIDDGGWTAELRIPFSQLRFHKNSENVWGINLRRDIARNNEEDYFVYIPKNENGFVSRFAQLKGINGITPPGKFEILPYITTRAEYTHPEPNDPFNNGSDYIPGLGADFKVGLGTNLNLNATINPDFGQVEIDPAVINLSDVETFFDEKRPFFVEGSTIFNFGEGGATNYWGFNWANPDFFYSRRIGRTPQGDIPEADFTDYPDGTHILGAAKITGKIGDSWNIGVIQSLTSREFARIENAGMRSKTEVEPMTYYGIVRAQNEINDGYQGLGFMSTVTSRFFKDDRLRDEINKDAYVFGIDGWNFLDSSKTWVIAGWTGLSHVSGSQSKILDLQSNPQHYFQRPDAASLSLDSSAKNLTGYAGRFYLNKQKGNFFFNSAFGFISPNFDLNDLGFLWRADVLNMHVGAGYFWTEQTSIYRHLEAGGAVFRNYDYDGNITWEGIFHFGFIRFLNYYTINWNLAYNPETINNRRTRGGPLTLNPPGYQVNAYLSSDDKKDIIIGAGFFTYQTNYSYNWDFNSSVEVRPSSNVSISIEPYYSINNEFAQWVDSFSDETAVNTFGRRYVFAKLDQKTFGAGIRLNWTFTPELSLQLYAQPLISSADYKNFKELAAPKTYDFNIYGTGSSTFDESTLTADPDGNGPANPIQIENPDKSFKSLRGNVVLRWEFVPGSIVYFVWTQTRSDSEENGVFRFGRSFRRLFNTEADNIFMVKFSYWFNM
ncbi:MAG: hypothetical protein A2V93_01815 [Ignavibacteria bacterium RBG_16_34_14]|nr:MAG: hypothetical protein A2V93_01815 [Ignavibacteria bacterium RBG_16_34_14]